MSGRDGVLALGCQGGIRGVGWQANLKRGRRSSPDLNLSGLSHVILGLALGWVAPLDGGAQASRRAGAEPPSGARPCQAALAGYLGFRQAARLCAACGVR